MNASKHILNNGSNIEKIKNFVETNYLINIDHIEKIKGVYKITADKKVYCFKIIKYEYGHFLFIYSAMKHLQNNGFEKIPKFIKNKYGMEYTKFFDKNAYLTEWIQARKCDYGKYFDVSRAALKLAELHRKSEGFIVTPEMKPRIGWLRWIKTFDTRKNEILDFKNRINKKQHISEFDECYIKVMQKELKRCDFSINNLIKSDYENKMKEEIKKRGFCHHDYANHNVLIEKNNEVNIIDFDYCMLDTHLHDLSSLLIRKMKNGKWSINNVVSVLDIYDNITKIKKSDIPIMAAFIEFPQAYWQIGIQYYWEKQPWGEEFFVKKLNRIIDDREERQEFVNEFKEINY